MLIKCNTALTNFVPIPLVCYYTTTLMNSICHGRNQDMIETASEGYQQCYTLLFDLCKCEKMMYGVSE